MIHKLKFPAIFLGMFLSVFAVSVVVVKAIDALQTQTNSWQPFVLLSATSTTATSTNLANGGGYVVTAGAKKAEFQFKRGDTRGTGNAGQSLFKLQGTIDGSVWTDIGRLILATTSSQTIQSSVVLLGTSTATVSLDLRTDTFYAVRAIAIETTDGEHTVSGAVEF